MKPYNCDQCEKSFRQFNNLVRHKRTHTRAKPYHRNQRDKSFRQSSSLIKHKSAHTEMKPYQCGQHDKTFIQSAQLAGHTGMMPRHCEQSDESCSKFVSLSVDQRSQTEERPYSSYSLVRYRKVSQMKGMFSCDHCDKWFELLSDLNRHVQENLLFDERSSSLTLGINLR